LNDFEGKKLPIGGIEAQIFVKQMIDSIVVETKGGFPSHPLELGHSAVQKLHRSIPVVDCHLQSQDHRPPLYRQFVGNHKASLQIDDISILAQNSDA